MEWEGITGRVKQLLELQDRRAETNRELQDRRADSNREAMERQQDRGSGHAMGRELDDFINMSTQLSDTVYRTSVQNIFVCLIVYVFS